MKSTSQNESINEYLKPLKALYDCDYSPNQVLRFLQSQGTIDLDEVAHQMREKEIDKLLKDVHKYSISQLKDGRWKTHVKDPSKKEGRRVIVKRTLTELRESLYQHYTFGDGADPKNRNRAVTLRTLYPEWIEYRRLHTEAETTIMRFQSVWKNHYLNSDIINIPIQLLDYITLDVWAHTYVKENNPTKKSYYNFSCIMNQMLKYAVAAGIIETNPFDKVHINSKQFARPKRKSNNEQVFTDEDILAITTQAWQDFHNHHYPVHQLTPLAILFQLQTGMRAGEVCAIRYEDIDGSIICVQRMYREPTKEVVNHTKGSGEARDVILTDTAVKIIEAARQRQQEEGVSSDGYIFSMTDNPFPYDSLRDSYTRYCKLINTPQKGSHCSRKTFISALQDGGVNLNTIREMVGHQDARTTLNNYVYDRSQYDERKMLIQNALTYV